MPTNEERREVAARLRKYIRFAKERDQNDEGKMINENGNVMFRNIAEAVGGNYANFIDSYEETLTKLADLIEPEPERTCRIEPGTDEETAKRGPFESYLSCSECRGPIQHTNYCPHCGAKVVE